MASLTATLTLYSTDATSDTLNLTTTNTLVVDSPITNFAKTTVGTSTAVQLLDKTIATAATYVYLKNTDSTNFVFVKTDDDATWGKLHPGEMMFFCVYPDIGLELKSDTAACKVEYAFFTKSA